MTDEIYNFKAIIDTKIYYSYDTFFGVYTFSTTDNIPLNGKEHIIAGQMQHLEEGMSYMITALLTTHKQWGKQYKPITITSIKPDNVDAALVFLKAFCTERQARFILQTYPDFINMVLDGVDAFDVKYVSSKTMTKLIRTVRESYSMNDIISKLSPIGITFNMIKKLIEGTGNIEILKEKLNTNPYVLTSIHGLGFKKIDQLALRINPELKGSQKRFEAFVEYVLRTTANTEGSTMVPKSKILVETNKFDGMIEGSFEKYIELNSLIGDDKYYTMESDIYYRIKELSKENSFVSEEHDISVTEERMHLTFTEEQRQAFTLIDKNDFLIITGNAGTGKSTILSGLVDMFDNKEIALCALSAKAASRMKELTGHLSLTIHKLLGWDGTTFTFNEKNKLKYDVVILDEASMVNIYMFWNLINAIKGKFIIVFDHAQLPPIGSGNIAADLLKMEGLNKVILTKIHRQAAKSGIIVHANQIRKGINPNKIGKSDTFGELKDMSYRFYRRDQLQRAIIEMYMAAVKKYGADKAAIIVPRKSNVALSTKVLNEIIHKEIFTDSIPSISYGKKKFYLGAKIIQKVNNYKKMIFNGEIGFISKIEKDIYYVSFADREVEFDREEMKNMELAYAITVHSYQGSQAEIIIVGIDWTHYILLDNCLLYTAITRAIKHCVVIAEKKAFDYAIRVNKGKERVTFLSQIIAGKIKPKEIKNENGNI